MDDFFSDGESRCHRFLCSDKMKPHVWWSISKITNQITLPLLPLPPTAILSSSYKLQRIDVIEPYWRDAHKQHPTKHFLGLIGVGNTIIAITGKDLLHGRRYCKHCYILEANFLLIYSWDLILFWKCEPTCSSARKTHKCRWHTTRLM